VHNCTVALVHRRPNPLCYVETSSIWRIRASFGSMIIREVVFKIAQLSVLADRGQIVFVFCATASSFAGSRFRLIAVQKRSHVGLSPFCDWNLASR